MYYMDENTNSVQCKAYACISDHTINDTIAVYTFVTKLLLEYLKLGVGGMSKGLQILLLGILFERLYHNNTKFWTKKQVL